MKFENLKPFKTEGKSIKILVIAGNKVVIEAIKLVLEKTFPKIDIEIANKSSLALYTLTLSTESEFDLILLSRSPRFEDERSKKGMEIVSHLQRFRKNACLMFLYSTENGTGDLLLKRGEIDHNVGISELMEVFEAL